MVVVKFNVRKIMNVLLQLFNYSCEAFICTLHSRFHVDSSASSLFVAGSIPRMLKPFERQDGLLDASDTLQRRK
jgi:hypothetical protein